VIAGLGWFFAMVETVTEPMNGWTDSGQTSMETMWAFCKKTILEWWGNQMDDLNGEASLDDTLVLSRPDIAKGSGTGFAIIDGCDCLRLRANGWNTPETGTRLPHYFRPAVPLYWHRQVGRYRGGLLRWSNRRTVIPYLYRHEWNLASRGLYVSLQGTAEYLPWWRKWLRATVLLVLCSVIGGSRWRFSSADVIYWPIRELPRLLRCWVLLCYSGEGQCWGLLGIFGVLAGICAYSVWLSGARLPEHV
jgi:hypothetical protein